MTTDDRDRIEAELQEIAEEYVLRWLGETDSKAVKEMVGHLRHRQAAGLRVACEHVPDGHTRRHLRTLAAALDGEEI